MIDDHVLNRYQYKKNHRADDVIASDHEVPERLDDLARRPRAGVPMNQNETRRRDIQSQPH